MCRAVALANLCVSTFLARLCPRAVALAFLYASSEAKNNTGFTYNLALGRSARQKIWGSEAALAISS